MAGLPLGANRGEAGGAPPPAGGGAPLRISLVTPVFNSAPWLEASLRSVLSQGYPNLEYIVVDGGSTDGSVDILRAHEKHFAWWTSEPDRGMYHALNKGFARSTGEIMGWISATDLLHQGGLQSVAQVFAACPEVEWLTGVPTAFDEAGATIGVGPVERWSRIRFLLGANRYIQQESTYWRRSLWQRSGARMDDSRRAASDFELWVRFFRHARLYPVATLIGGYRRHADSLGLQTMEACHQIHAEVLATELATLRGAGWIRAFRAFDAAILRVPKLRAVWIQTVRRALHRLPGPDLPPIVRYRPGKGWTTGR